VRKRKYRRVDVELQDDALEFGIDENSTYGSPPPSLPALTPPPTDALQISALSPLSSQVQSQNSQKSLSPRQMLKHLSPSLQAAVRQFRQRRVGTGKGGMRVSLYEKWVSFQRGVAFPNEDLHFVLMEFQKAASHASGY